MMWVMGSDNWIKYGWGDELSSDWTPNIPLVIDCTSFDTTNLTNDAITAATEAVIEITKTYPGPYTLMCSGGIDSQSMIWSWHKAGVDFNIVSVRYISDGIFFNDYDLVQLDEFCTKYGFTIQYKDFDLINFLEVDLPDVAIKYDCDSPQISTHIQMSRMIDTGTVLYSGNFLQPIGILLGYTLLGLHRYAESNPVPIKVIPYFFLHTAKLAHAFLNTWHDLYTPNAANMPEKVYKAAGFPVISQNGKFNGFEKIKKYYDNDKYRERVKPIDRLRFATKNSKRTFDLLFRYPYEGPGICKATMTSVQRNNFKRGYHE